MITEADVATAEARRAATRIMQWGWRPSAHAIQDLRDSTKHAPAYRVLCRAWRKAGFKTAFIRKLAGRAR